MMNTTALLSSNTIKSQCRDCVNGLSGNSDRFMTKGRTSQVQSPSVLRKCAANPAIRYLQITGATHSQTAAAT